MNNYVKQFLHRGLMFGGFGCIVVGIVYAIVSAASGVALTGGEMCLAIVSGYLLAFVQAGASVFNQIEHWPLPKSLFWHFLSLYAVYVGCYLINRWIPFAWSVVLLFTAIFAVLYFVIWLTVYLITKSTAKRMNAKL